MKQMKVSSLKVFERKRYHPVLEWFWCILDTYSILFGHCFYEVEDKTASAIYS